jgi:uncharacterized protein
MKTSVLTALFVAVMGLSAHSQNKSGVFVAVKFNDSTTLAMCLRAGLKVNTVSTAGNTLLMEASRNGSYASAKLLLANGAKVDARDEMGSTALMEAAWKGDVAIATLLLKAGANSGLVNKAGQTALSIALDTQKEGIIKLLSNRNDINYIYVKR